MKVILAGMVALVLVILGFGVNPASAAVVSSVEAETMTSVQGYGTFVQSDASASGGKRLWFESNVTAQKTFSLPSPTTQYTVRAFQDGDATGALIKILIDGAWAGQWYVKANTWATYTVNRNIAAGSHNLKIQMLNAETRNLYVDVTRFLDASTGDTTPPSAPTSLRSTGTTASSVSLAWNASTDNVGVTGYEVYRGGTRVGTPTGTTFTDSGLSASTSYSYTVKAKDAAGNLSAASNQISVTTQAASTETRMQAYVTGYSWFDNTPPGSAQIAYPRSSGYPTLHDLAGGTGTYADPITVAVGHSLATGTSVPVWPAGTRFYIPNLRRYFIVEDACGDGPTPQNGPCYTGYPSPATTWLDVWVGGEGGTDAGADACMSDITDVWLAIKDPASNYAVVSGDIYGPPCTAQFGNTVVTV